MMGRVLEEAARHMGTEAEFDTADSSGFAGFEKVDIRVIRTAVVGFADRFLVETLQGLFA